MQRRVAMSASIAAATSLAIGTVAFGAVGGASILGFSESAPMARRSALIVTHRTETIDEVVVVPSQSSIDTTAGAADSTVMLAPIDPGTPAAKVEAPNPVTQPATTT